MLQELTGEIEKTARAVLDDVHTALPGEIISFDTKEGLATVKPIGKFSTADGKVFEYPIITEVPVVFPFCEKSRIGMAFPVDAGDSCLIIVSENELDEWRNGSEAEGFLRFDLTNAVAIPGLLSKGNDIVAKAVKDRAVIIAAPNTEVKVSENGVDVTKGSVTFGISESGIAIGGDLKVEGNISYTGDIKSLK